MSITPLQKSSDPVRNVERPNPTQRMGKALSPGAIGRSTSAGVRWALGKRSTFLDKLAITLVVFLLTFAVIGPMISIYDPYLAVPTEALRSPGAEHWFGTDDAGRDVLSRVMAGAQSTLLAAIAVVLCTTAVGVFVASVAAFSPRRVDELIMRICDMFMALPSMVLALGIAAAMGASLGSVVVAMVIAHWPGTARLVRGIFRETMSTSYVESARVLGVSRLRQLFRHVLPNSMDSVYVQASMEISGTIVLMAGLAYLGVGAPPPSADWGAMVAQGREYMTTAWWAVTFPAVFITVAAIAFGLLGDAVRVRLDPNAQNN